MPQLSPRDKKYYEQLVWLLHGLEYKVMHGKQTSPLYSFTTRFLNEPESREAIVNEVRNIVEPAFCPDEWCPHKEKGCVPCVYEIGLRRHISSQTQETEPTRGRKTIATRKKG